MLSLLLRVFIYDVISPCHRLVTATLIVLSMSGAPQAGAQIGVNLIICVDWLSVPGPV